MKFKLGKDWDKAQVQVGYELIELTPDDEHATWDSGAIEALERLPSTEQVTESAGEVIEQVSDASDQDLRSILTFDDRPSVVAAVEEEQARRAGDAEAESPGTESPAAEPAPVEPAPTEPEEDA